MKLVYAVLLLLGFSVAARAQDADTAAFAEPYITKEFIIVQSTKNYNQALTKARAVASKLKLKLDLRNLKPSKTMGLTLPKKECEEYYDYPCYIARGRGDDGQYISIEYSSQYNGFAEGYYIVIVGSGPEGDAGMAKLLKKTKTVCTDAYKKKSRVYVGCMH